VESSRKYPVILDSQSFSETVHVRLPEGFDIEEIPDPVKLVLPYARFESNCSAKDGGIVCHRSLRVEATTIPADQYPLVRDFFEHVYRAERAAIVLVKK